MEGKSVLKDLYDSYKKHDAHVCRLEAELDVELDTLTCQDPCYKPIFDIDWDGMMYD